MWTSISSIKPRRTSSELLTASGLQPDTNSLLQKATQEGDALGRPRILGMMSQHKKEPCSLNLRKEASNILADRLRRLVEGGLLTRE